MNAVSPMVLIALFLVSATTVFFACYLLRRQKSKRRTPEKGQVENVEPENKKQQTKGKRQRRINVKKEIRALEMEEKKRKRQEKKEEAKVERARMKKVDGKKEEQKKKQKTLRVGEEKNFNGVGRAVTTRSIPRKRS